MRRDYIVGKHAVVAMSICGIIVLVVSTGMSVYWKAILVVLITTVALPGILSLMSGLANSPAPGFNNLASKPVGAGKAGKRWHISNPDGPHGGGNPGKYPLINWLGHRELESLEALCDTLLPGFDISTKENAAAVMSQAILVLRGNLFIGAKNSRGSASASPNFPPALQAYTRAIARRCLDTAGRSASEIGVAGRLAQSYQTNLPDEQLAGLRTALWFLNTSLGGFLLTGNPLPVPAQSFAERHALMRWWSRSRIGKFREAFQGVKRLGCSTYFSAHTEVTVSCASSPSSHLEPGSHSARVTAREKALATALVKTNPSWCDIRYEPQHHRLAQGEGPWMLSPERRSASTGGDVVGQGAKPELWSSAKVRVVQDMVVQAARAAVAASPTSRYSNPPSPSSLSCTAANTKDSRDRHHHSLPVQPRSELFSRSVSVGNIGTPDRNDTRARGPGSDVGVKSSCPRSTPSAWNDARRPSCTKQPSFVGDKLVVDVVVVGSGAGGGCVAGVLAEKGLRVAVLEKGGLYDASDYASFSEMEAYKALYEKQGVITSDDAGVVLLAGSCVGGGTTVNWSASFRTPRHVRMEWARRLGLKSFELGGPYDRALDAVCERLSVNTHNSHRAPDCPSAHDTLRISQHNESLWNGATASSLRPKPIPRNAKGCVDCGSCLHGCAFGKKRSTHATWLKDGIDTGNIVLIPNAEVTRVLMDGGRATGVEANVTQAEGGKATPLTVLSRAVVVSGGSLHTPAILLRSGLKHPLIGRHLCLHPVVIVCGVFPEKYREGTGDNAEGTIPAADKQAKQNLDAGQGNEQLGTVVATPTSGENCAGGGDQHVADFGRGVMMGVYVQDWMGLDNGYGFAVEAPPMHPGLMALCLPWNDAITHRLAIGMARETSVFCMIKRDRSSEDNRVVLGPRGDPVVKYELEEEDTQGLIRGRTEMLRLMKKAGASLLVPGHEGAPWFCPAEGQEHDEELEEYIKAVEDMGITKNQAGVYSAHQMGSCRLSATPEGGPLRESGETWECDGLFVADASTFPTAIGINPMITIEAISFMVAEQVATRLGKESWPPGPEKTLESSPIRRRVARLGKVVARAMSRDPIAAWDEQVDAMSGSPTDGGSTYDGSSGVGRKENSPPNRRHGLGNLRRAYRSLSPIKQMSSPSLRAQTNQREQVASGDDFGVDLSKLVW